MMLNPWIFGLESIHQAWQRRAKWRSGWCDYLKGAFPFQPDRAILSLTQLLSISRRRKTQWQPFQRRLPQLPMRSAQYSKDFAILKKGLARQTSYRTQAGRSDQPKSPIKSGPAIQTQTALSGKAVACYAG
jgi:hypothetical protein